MAFDLAHSLHDPEALTLAKMVMVMRDFVAGRWRRVLQRGDEVEQALREHCTGAAWEVATVHMFIVGSRFPWATCTSCHAACRDNCATPARGGIYAAMALQTGLGSVVWLARDAVNTVRQHAADARAQRPSDATLTQHFEALLTQELLYLYIGDGLAFHRLVQECMPRLRQAWLHRVGFLGFALQRGILRPERFADMLAPGFTPP